MREDRSSRDRLASVVLTGLATYRIARILPKDQVAQGARSRLDHWALEGTTDESQWKLTVATLLTCPVCAGWWLALVLSVGSGRRRGASPVTSVLDGIAAAGIAALLARFDDFMDKPI